MRLLVGMVVSTASEFTAWFDKLPMRIQGLIESRVFRIEEYEHFGDCKDIGEGVAELRWRNGLRIYFLKLSERSILLLNGGGKNDQTKCIKRAKILAEKYAHKEVKK